MAIGRSAHGIQHNEPVQIAGAVDHGHRIAELPALLLGQREAVQFAGIELRAEIEARCRALLNSAGYRNARLGILRVETAQSVLDAGGGGLASLRCGAGRERSQQDHQAGQDADHARVLLCVHRKREGGGASQANQNGSAPPVALYALACASNRGKSPDKHPPANGGRRLCVGVIPAQAGIHVRKKYRSHICLAWVPAFAGTTLRNRPEDQAPGLVPVSHAPSVTHCKCALPACGANTRCCPETGRVRFQPSPVRSRPRPAARKQLSAIRGQIRIALDAGI